MQRESQHRDYVDGSGLIAADPYLEPWRDALRARHCHYRERRRQLTDAFGSLDGAAHGYEYFGFNRGSHGGREGVWYREWAPGADALFAIGDFNGWDRQADPMTRDQFGVWSRFLPDDDYGDRLVHGSHVKVHVHGDEGPQDRIPAYIRRVVQDPEHHHFNGQYWCPPEPYAWRHDRPRRLADLRIYEAHVGMAQEMDCLGSYRQFADNILPRIVEAGYNAVQLMAIQEHPYYGSFGYHVSNLYAPSSRFGTPEDLKELIDRAHGLGLAVFLDIVHSHMVRNVHEGLNGFDGTGHHYFHAGGRGIHMAWDSMLYDYGKTEVLRFLLGNLRWWLTEYRFDGLRFDGVTSMMYLDHGLGQTYGGYDCYFDASNLDADAIAYLQLANDLAHEILPEAVTIAEDVSGMPGTARPIEEGGLGFDYRLAMGIPDYWIKLIKECRDEDWRLGELYHVLTNRRHNEPHVAYAESHDQALVGDKTLAFRLMDADMYWHMDAFSRNPVIDRGVALHKMIRLVTFFLGGEAYLNFMGNEFGHPEWIDFPRPGNNYSYQHARRQWSLLHRPGLRYECLGAFDRAMQRLDDQFRILGEPDIGQLLVDEQRKLLVVRRGRLVLACNWHPTASFSDLRLSVPEQSDYALALNTDAAAFGGLDRVDTVRFPWLDEPAWGLEQSIMTYLPSRTAQVLVPVDLVQAGESSRDRSPTA